MKKKFIVATILLIATTMVVVTQRNQNKNLQSTSTQPITPPDNYATKIVPKTVEELNLSNIEVVAKNLTVPWEVAFLPSGEMLVTQRTGELLKIGTDTKIVAEIEGVTHVGEGGLLGLALHPAFKQNNYIYLYFTSTVNNKITNRVERYKLENDALAEKKVILQGINGAANHDGGRLAFGPDNLLYITTGDAQEEGSAQDKNSLSGKILRVTDEGRIPSSNPFGNAVYSLGHRNPQGLAWDKEGRLWSSEHGPSGLGSGFDEINLIEAGSNYGWPLVKGDEAKEGFILPTLHSGSRDTWAPSGLAYKDGSLFFAGLRGEALYQAKLLESGKLSLSEHFKGQFGRIRAVVVGPDGNLYFSTSNTDGRGNPSNDDDQIVKAILK